MDENHTKYHSSHAFCGSAGPEEMQHLQDLIDELTDDELKELVRKVGIRFSVDDRKLRREDYEGVINEAGREIFYKEYRKVMKVRQKNLTNLQCK